jgi:hypothetical protein
VTVGSGVNPSKVKVYGPAIEKPVKTSQPTYLIVDCKEAGIGPFLSALQYTQTAFFSLYLNRHLLSNLLLRFLDCNQFHEFTSFPSKVNILLVQTC